MDEQVVLDFVADTAEAVAAVDELRRATKDLAAADEEAKAAQAGVRDKALEAAAALKICRDEQGKLRNDAGEVITASEAEALALKHIRDQALEAAWAQRELDRYQRGSVAARLGTSLSGAAASFFGGSGAPLPGSFAAMIAVVPAVEALLPELTGLVSGFAAAGVGAGAFALLALPAFKSVATAYTQIQSDQQAYDRALTKTAKSDALKHLQADYAALSGPQRHALAGVQNLVTEWHKASGAFAPEAFKVLSDFLRLAGQLLPVVAPFAQTFASALSGLLQAASRFTASKGFKDWLNQFHSLEGPAITAIGTGIGHVANSLGKLLTVMSAKDVVNAINIAFTVLNGTIQIVTYMVKRLMDNWDGMSVAARHTWYDIKRWTDDVTHAFDYVRHLVASWGHDIAHTFDTVRHKIATWAHDIAHTFDTVRHDIAHLVDNVVTFFKNLIDNVVTFFKNLPGKIVSALGNLGRLLVNAGKDIVNGLISGVESMGSTLVNAIVDLIPGPVRSAVSAALGILSPSTVFHGYGVNIVQGLINGLAAMQPQLRAAMGAVTGTVAGTGPALAASAVAPGSWLRHSVDVHVSGAAAGSPLSSAEYQQALYAAIQEVTLRYGAVNPGNGLTPAWGR